MSLFLQQHRPGCPSRSEIAFPDIGELQARLRRLREGALDEETTRQNATLTKRLAAQWLQQSSAFPEIDEPSIPSECSVDSSHLERSKEAASESNELRVVLQDMRQKLRERRTVETPKTAAVTEAPRTRVRTVFRGVRRFFRALHDDSGGGSIPANFSLGSAN